MFLISIVFVLPLESGPGWSREGLSLFIGVSLNAYKKFGKLHFILLFILQEAKWTWLLDVPFNWRWIILLYRNGSPQTASTDYLQDPWTKNQGKGHGSPLGFIGGVKEQRIPKTAPTDYLKKKLKKTTTESKGTGLPIGLENENPSVSPWYWRRQKRPHNSISNYHMTATKEEYWETGLPPWSRG